MREASHLVPIEDCLVVLRRDFVFHCPSFFPNSSTLSAKDGGGANRGERGGGGGVGSRLAAVAADRDGEELEMGEGGGGGRVNRDEMRGSAESLTTAWEFDDVKPKTFLSLIM